MTIAPFTVLLPGFLCNVIDGGAHHSLGRINLKRPKLVGVLANDPPRHQHPRPVRSILIDGSSDTGPLLLPPHPYDHSSSPLRRGQRTSSTSHPLTAINPPPLNVTSTRRPRHTPESTVSCRQALTKPNPTLHLPTSSQGCASPGFMPPQVPRLTWDMTYMWLQTQLRTH